MTRLLLIVDLASLVRGVIGCCEVLEEERVANYSNLTVDVIAIFRLQIGFKFSDSVEQVFDTLRSIGVGLSYDIQCFKLRVDFVHCFILSNLVLGTLLQVLDEPIRHVIVLQKER